MYVAEAAALDVIAATANIRVPRPIVHGYACGQSYLVLEYLELGLHGDAKLLGEQLAALHRCSAPQFGFAQDNFIGTTPQTGSGEQLLVDGLWVEPCLQCSHDPAPFAR